MCKLFILTYSTKGKKVTYTALHSAWGKSLQDSDNSDCSWGDQPAVSQSAGSKTPSTPHSPHHYENIPKYMSLFSKIISTHRKHPGISSAPNINEEIIAWDNTTGILGPNLPRDPTNAMSTYKRKIICGFWQTNLSWDVQLVAAQNSNWLISHPEIPLGTRNA